MAPMFMMKYSLVEDELDHELRLDLDITDFRMPDLIGETFNVDLDISGSSDIKELTFKIEAYAMPKFVEFIGFEIEKSILDNIDNFLRNNGTQRYLPSLADTTIDFSFFPNGLIFSPDNNTSAFFNGTFFDDKNDTKTRWEYRSNLEDDY